MVGILAALGYTAAIYYFVVMPYGSRWKAIYGGTKAPEGYTIHGIDISHHQGTIDWERLQKARIGDEPLSFVFVKATEGQSVLDANFNDNFYEAREHGFIRGAYHYFSPGVSPRLQAEYYLHQGVAANRGEETQNTTDNIHQLQVQAPIPQRKGVRPLSLLDSTLLRR